MTKFMRISIPMKSNNLNSHKKFPANLVYIEFIIIALDMSINYLARQGLIALDYPATDSGR